MRVVFMGTPEFAAVHLGKLSESGHDIIGVYTQPDRPKGRGKQVQPSAVKRAAEAMSLTVRQPARLADAAEIGWLRDAAPDVIAVVAYGQKVPPAILSLPAYGCINIHASLLPKYRGAAPIQRAILEGETETGVTAMQMDEGWDTGDILAQRRVPISPNADAGSLHDRLAEVGADLLAETLETLPSGEIQPQRQDDRRATFAPKLRKDDGFIDWGARAIDIERKVRALRPWPGAFTYWQDRPVRVWRAEVAGPPEEGAAPSGTVLAIDERDGGVTVQAGAGVIRLLEVQPANRRKMPASDFAHGARIRPGRPDARFGGGTAAPASTGEARA